MIHRSSQAHKQGPSGLLAGRPLVAPIPSSLQSEIGGVVSGLMRARLAGMDKCEGSFELVFPPPSSAITPVDIAVTAFAAVGTIETQIRKLP